MNVSIVTGGLLGQGIVLGGFVQSDSGPPPTTNYDVITALQVWWQAQASLQTLTGVSKLYHLSAPEGTLLPYATYFLVSDAVDTRTTAGKVLKATVQCNIHADTDAQAKAVADDFSDALDTIK